MVKGTLDLNKLSSTEYTPEPPKINILPGQYHDTDRGNAERFKDKFSDKIRYCYPFRSWIVWDGKRWTKDEQGRVFQYARETIDFIFDEACELEGDRRKELIKFGFKSESTPSINNMIEQAKSQDGIPVLPSEYDIDTMKFNVQNGTIDLRTGKLGPHNIDDFITKISPAVYDPDAKCPVWDKFLDTTFQGRADLIAYHQRLCGYALTGSTNEESFDIFYGTGDNGKSKYTGAIIHIMGDYHIKINIETLHEASTTKGGNEASSDVAVLQGARLVTVSEPSKGVVLNEQRIKDWTGRDPITARPLYQKPVTFIPEFKVFMYTNHKPIIRTQGHSIWRRLKLSPFENKIEEKDKDRDLDKKLMAESSGILNWMIEGCLAWQKYGLQVPEEIIAATEEYKDEQDTLSDFFSDCCEIDPSYESYVMPIYLFYQAWAKVHDIDYPYKQKGFPAALVERGYKKVPKDDVGIRVKGIKLSVSSSGEYERLKSLCNDYPADAKANLMQNLITFLYECSRSKVIESSVRFVGSSDTQSTDNDFTLTNASAIRRIFAILDKEYGKDMLDLNSQEWYKNDIKSWHNCSYELASKLFKEAMRMRGQSV
uniref:Putative DNA primase n=1 Tax=viral metagenome TaxID=1070528 RepID=A0A6M3KC09_9ZZZZ